jgi:hypothetical protein
VHRYYGNSPIGELSATCKFMGVVEALQGQVPSSFLPVTGRRSKGPGGGLGTQRERSARFAQRLIRAQSERKWPIPAKLRAVIKNPAKDFCWWDLY